MKKKTIAFFSFDVLSFLVVLACYLSLVTYEDNGSWKTFFMNQVQLFSFQESLFDIMGFCFLRTAFVLLLFKVTSFGLLMVVFGISAAAFVVKCFLFEFTAGMPLEYVTIILGFFSCAAEIVVWTCLFPASIKHPLSHKYKSERKSRRTNDQKSINHVAKDFGDDSEQNPLLFSGSETGFDTPDELSDNDEGHHFLPKTVVLKDREYTAKELEILEYLRPKFPYRDDKLYKFMVARQMNLAKIEEMLDNHAKWRAKHDMEHVDLSASPQALRGYTSYKDTNGEDGDKAVNAIFDYNGCSTHKFAKNGEPVVYFRAGWSDAKGVVRTTQLETVERCLILVAEITLTILAAESERKFGRPIPKISVVVDLQSLGLRQLYLPALSFFTHMIQLLEDNYPESSGTIMMINAPPIFTAFWKIVSPVIPPRTMEKIFFLGADYKKTLLQFIPAENLPACYGGLCTCRIDGGCVPFPISPGYTDPSLDSEGLYTAKLKKQESFRIPVAIREEDLERQKKFFKEEIQIKVQFKNEAGQLEFACFFQPNFNTELDESTAQVLASPSLLKDFEVTKLANEVGTFWFRWSNTSPSAASTVLHYKIR